MSVEAEGVHRRQYGLYDSTRLRREPTTTLGYNVRQARKARNMSIGAVERNSGVAKSTVTDLESGRKTTVHAETLYKIAVALGVRMEDLLGVPRVEHAVAGKVLKLRGRRNAVSDPERRPSPNVA